MSTRSPRTGSRHALGLTRRFQLVVVVLIMVLGGVGWAGLSSLASANRSLESVYRVDVTDQQVVTDLSGNLDDAEEMILRGWVTADVRLRARLTTRLNATDLPEIELDIDNLHGFASENPKEERIATQIRTQWVAFETLWGDGQRGNGLSADRFARVAAITASLDALTTDADEIYALENSYGTQHVLQARASAASGRRTMILALPLGVLLSLTTVLWLTRAVLPRILSGLDLLHGAPVGGAAPDPGPGEGRTAARAVAVALAVGVEGARVGAAQAQRAPHGGARGAAQGVEL